MDTKREGSVWHRYALIEDDKALLAEIPAQAVVSGDKLTLLHDSPAEADIAPVGQLRRDAENGGVAPTAFEQQHCASSILAQQTMHRNNNAFGGGGGSGGDGAGRPFFLDNYQLYTPFRNSPPSAAHHNNSKNTNDGGTNTTTTMTTTSSSTLATIGTNTYNSSSTNGGGARPKLSINADGILIDGNGRILCDGGGGGSSCGGVLEAEEDNRELVDQLDNQLERFHSHNQQQRLQLLSTTTNYSNYHRSSEYIPNANANQQQQYHQQHNRSSTMGNLPRKLNKKTTRKEKGTDIFVQELDGYFGFKPVEDIMLEFQPQKSSNTTVAVAGATTSVGRKKEKAKLTAAASSASVMQLNQQSQQQATAAASGRKKAKRVSSTTRRSAQKQQQQQRNPKHQQQQQQQQQCRVVQGSRDTSTEEMEVSIELDTANADEPKLEQEHQQKLLQQQNRAAEVVVANAGEDEGEGQQQPQQKLQQSLPSTAAADEGQSSSSKQKMKPLLERIPKHVLRQLYEKKGWQCPITICNPFLNSSGPASDGDSHSVMEGPIAPWLELSDEFPLPTELHHQLQQLQRVVPSSTTDCYCFEPKV